MIRIDPNVLVHEFEYHEYTGQDRFKQPNYDEPLTVSKVRVDESSVFSRDGDQKRILANAVIFVYNGYSEPFVEFKEQSKIVFNGKDYLLSKVIPIAEPYSDKLFSVELEVV